MAKAPWFPFYTGDFLASTDVQLMEAHEVGAYLLLLAHSWQSDAPGFLPNDEGRLRRLARLSADQWKESRELLLSKWPEAAEDASLRSNPRLVKEAGKQVEMRELKAEAGRKSAERRARMATEGQQSGNTIPTGVGITPTGVGEKSNYSQPQSQSQEGKPSSSLRSEAAAPAAAEPEKKIEAAEPVFESPAPPQTTPPVAKSPRAVELHFPEWATSNFREEWEKWVAYRQKKRDRLKPESLQKLLDKLGQFDEAYCTQLFDNAIANGYTGLVFGDTAQKFAHYLQAQQPGYVHGNQHPAPTGVASYGQHRPATVHPNPFGVASPVSLAIAGALAVGSRDSNYGLEL